MLFGIFAVHSPESCPLNNTRSRKIFLEIENKMKMNIKKFHVSKVVAFYMSVLELEWVIILDGKSAHDIEQLCIVTGIYSISTIKIVPMNEIKDTVKRIKS